MDSQNRTPKTGEAFFFLYFAPVAVHNPIAPSDQWRGSSGIGPYGDYIHDVDHSVGEILDALAYSGVLENTIVIFTSDNGGDIGYQIEEKQAREKGFKNNGDLRGDKHTIWEGGFKVPFVARWPNVIKEGSQSESMINIVDIFSTIQEMVGGEAQVSKTAAADSFSFYSELIGNASEKSSRETMVLNDVRGVVAIRMDDWKYIEGIAAKPLKKAQQKHSSKDSKPKQLRRRRLPAIVSRSAMVWTLCPPTERIIANSTRLDLGAQHERIAYRYVRWPASACSLTQLRHRRYHSCTQ